MTAATRIRSRPVLSEADLRLAARAVRMFARSIRHNAARHDNPPRPGRMQQLARIELLLRAAADRRRQLDQREREVR